MSYLFSILDSFIPLFVFAGSGYVLYALKGIGNNQLDALIRLTNDVCVPIIFIRLIPKATMPDISTLSLILIYNGIIFSLFIGVFFYAKTYRKQTAQHANIWGMSAIFSNTFLLGVPLAIYTFGENLVTPYLVIIGFDILVVFTFIIFLLEAGSSSKTLPFQEKLWFLFSKVFRHPIILGMLIGLCLQLTEIEIPAIIDSTFLQIQNMNAPLAVAAFGATIARFGVRSHLIPAIIVSAIKLFVIPTLVLLAILYLGNIPTIWAQSILLMSALPIGISAFVFATRYEIGKDFASTSIFISSVVSPFTLIVIFYLFENWHILPLTP